MIIYKLENRILCPSVDLHPAYCSVNNSALAERIQGHA